MSTRRNTLTNQIVINHAKKALEISQKFKNETLIFGSDAYNLLKEAQKEFEGYRVSVRSSSKKTLEEKIKLKDIIFYVEKHSGKDSEAWKELEELRGKSVEQLKEELGDGYIFETQEAACFFLIKKWFFKTYPELKQKSTERQKRIEEIVAGAA